LGKTYGAVNVRKDKLVIEKYYVMNLHVMGEKGPPRGWFYTLRGSTRLRECLE